jgi:putative thioredoxin
LGSYDIQDFELDVIEASHEVPIVVDFWADWCGPCRVLGPILEKLAAESGDRWRLAKVDTERFPEEASRYGVRGIPNVKLFTDGAPAGEFVGALPEAQVREWLQRMLPSDADRAVASALEEANRLSEEGRFLEAQKVLESALESAAADSRLTLGLARIVVFQDPARARTLLADLDYDAGDQDLVESTLRLASLLDAEPSSGDSEGTDMKGRFAEALGRLRQRDFERAFEGLLVVLREGPVDLREAAGEACVALFQFLGPSHPAVTRFRGEVAGALYR